MDRHGLHRRVAVTLRTRFGRSASEPRRNADTSTQRAQLDRGTLAPRCGPERVQDGSAAVGAHTLAGTGSKAVDLVQRHRTDTPLAHRVRRLASDDLGVELCKPDTSHKASAHSRSGVVPVGCRTSSSSLEERPSDCLLAAIMRVATLKKFTALFKSSMLDARFAANPLAGLCNDIVRSTQNQNQRHAHEKQWQLTAAVKAMSRTLHCSRAWVSIVVGT